MRLGDTALATTEGDRMVLCGGGGEHGEADIRDEVGDEGGIIECLVLQSSSIADDEDRERVSASDSGNKVSQESVPCKAFAWDDSKSRYFDHVSVITSRSTSTVSTNLGTTDSAFRDAHGDIGQGPSTIIDAASSRSSCIKQKSSLSPRPKAVISANNSSLFRSAESVKSVIATGVKDDALLSCLQMPLGQDTNAFSGRACAMAFAFPGCSMAFEAGDMQCSAAESVA